MNFNEQILDVFFQDNENHMKITQSIVDTMKSTKLVHFTSYVRPKEYFNHNNDNGKRVKVNQIIIDCDIENKEGISLLNFIKQNTSTKLIPVLILGNLKDRNHIINTYEEYVNAYQIKPALSNEFHRVMSITLKFWIQIAILP